MSLSELIRATQELLQRERLREIPALLDQVDRQIAAEAAPAEIVALVATLRANYAGQCGDYDEAQRILSRASELDPGNTRLNAWIMLQHGCIDMKKGDTTETRELFTKAMELASAAGDAGTEGDAAYNLGTLAAIAGEDETARSYWRRAMSAYQKSGRVAQINDCIHVLGATHRQADGNDQAAVAALDQSLKFAIAIEDHAAVARIAGDLARTHLCLFRDGRTDALKDAALALQPMLIAERVMWSEVHDAELNLDARTVRAEGSFNNLETAILVAHERKRYDEAFFYSCMAKGRICREDLANRHRDEVRRLCREHADLRLAVDTAKELDPELADIYALPFALTELAVAEQTKIAFVASHRRSRTDKHYQTVKRRPELRIC